MDLVKFIRDVIKLRLAFIKICDTIRYTKKENAKKENSIIVNFF